uniref:SpoU_methylase domain-containing protein n=1 Tax=Caenorhabditis tropicalis TaxID=1561998 RepID=A0A1I7TV29_9PELO
MEGVKSENQIRTEWSERAENLNNDEELSDFLAHLQIVDKHIFQIALPSLCIVSEKQNSDKIKKNWNEYALTFYAESTRPSRRAVLACLKEFRSSSVWNDFYTLIDALEEPQFHIIRPVLPRFDALLNAVRENKFDFIWMTIALFRAISHTNGWIRTWAIEKSISIDKEILEQNSEFITALIIPNLNNNDIFWRLLEKGKIESFLVQLGSVLETIKHSPMFIQNLLTSIESLSCPTAIYFVVSTLSNITSSQILSYQDIALMRRVVLRARYIPHKSIRITTLRNLLVFYAKVTQLDDSVLEEFSNIIAYFSGDSTPEMIDDAFYQIEKCIISAEYKPSESRTEHNFEQIFGKDSKNLGIRARMWWISIEKRDLREKFLSRLQLEVSELLGEKSSLDLSVQLFLLKERPNDLECSTDVLECMKNDLGEYILAKVISNEGSKNEFQLLHFLYTPLFFKYCSHLFIPFAMAIAKVLPEIKSCESATLLLTFFDSIVEKLHDDNVHLFRTDFLNYLGGDNVIGLKRQKKSIEDYDTKEFNNIVATLHSLRIKLLNRFIKNVEVDSFLTECIEQLDVSSAFLVKQQICHLISKFIRKCSDSKLVLQCIRACSNIITEEKKSLNSLPALECFVDVTLSAPQNIPEVSDESIKYMEAQLSIANQSTPVALILIDAITKYRSNLDVNWTPLIIKLALFGPVPKKETRVINYAYFKIFGKEEVLLEKDQIERLDEVVQKARFKAVVLAIKLSSEDSNSWPKALIEEIFAASGILDQSSSRSFGLSMAHRQKTRGVELLHLLTSSIEDKLFASTIFNFCISSVVDPCQQFSIKLIVEWTLARLCIKFENLLQQLIDDDFEKNMASQRIGAMCSWLNVLMLISRAAPQLVDKCLEKVIVWCTAQNFPVRCTALAAARLMFSTFDKDRRKKWRLVKAIVNFDAEPSGNSKRVVENLCTDFYFSKLHIDNHFDFETILTVIANRTGMPYEETIPITIIKELNDISNQIKSLNDDDVFLKAPSQVYSALSKNASCSPSMEDENEMEESEVQASVDDSAEESVQSSFQRKIIKENEVKDDGVSLIVVASLVDKPNNLGGICRTSEIFGVDTLVVADILVTQDSNFKALSMSSENWQKIEGVRPADLLEYLQNLRAEGYTVIAAEQTTDSIMMHDFVFPKKAVIVMGDEKEGVPVNLLRAVDQTVEIKQVGHTRSLNVHVTAALMIAKFAEQVRFVKI